MSTSQGINGVDESFTAKDINGKITKAAEKTQSMSLVCMYRVPQRLREPKKIAYYTPNLVSIGPLHRDDDHLNPPYMKDIKMGYADSLLCRTTKPKLEVLEKCVDKIKMLFERAKKCYAEEDAKKLNEEMLLIDGCFILELLFRSHSRSKETRDPILDNTLTSVTVQQDLLLLENQVPFFVLEELFNLTLAGIPNHPPRSLDYYVLSFFPHVLSLKCDVKRSNPTNSSSLGDQCVISISGEIYHMLHFLHNYYIPKDLEESCSGTSWVRVRALFHSFPWVRPRLNQNKKGESDIRSMPSASDLLLDQKKKDESEIKFMHSASDLDYAGVKFVAGTGEHQFKVKFTIDPGPLQWFRRARFEIPTLSIYDSTEVVLRNLIAFEQCCPAAPSYVTSYAFLMDRLINTVKDVEVLQKAGVICNYLGANEDASDLFNKLCKEVVLGKYYFAETCKQATGYSKRIWPAAMAHLRRKYFASPWTFIAFCAAYIAFAATLGNFILNLLRK